MPQLPSFLSFDLSVVVLEGRDVYLCTQKM